MVSALGRSLGSAVRTALKNLDTTSSPKPAARGASTPSLPIIRDTFTPAPTVGAGAVSTGREKQYMRTTGGTPVVSQREAGDYFCEHTAWTLNSEALKTGSSIAKDGLGKPLTGFLHLPGALDDPRSPTRHKGTSEVVGAAFRGDVDAIRAGNAKTSPVKLLLTGYGPFPGVSDNPTGSFVSNKANVDAAMKAGFGKDLLGPGKAVQTPAGEVFEYRVKDKKSGKPFTVQVMARQLDVADSAINGGPKSVQALLKSFKPQGALSLGVDPDAKQFEVVVRSDKGGLSTGPDGKPRHDDSKMRYEFRGEQYVPLESSEGQLFNDSLGRAIQAGHRARG